MKTINRDIDMFNDLSKAERAFKNSKVPCQLLATKKDGWFLDRSKTALKAWPQLYTLVDQK